MLQISASSEKALTPPETNKNGFKIGVSGSLTGIRHSSEL